MARAVICKGDPTSHGGEVLEGNETATIDGRPIALQGHRTYCPLCKGYFPISDGLDFHSFGGIGTAVEGMKTACGALLIATQHYMTVEDSVGVGESAPDDAGAEGDARVAADALAVAENGSRKLRAGTISQTNSSADLRNMVYKNLPTGTRLLVQAQESPTAGAGNTANQPQNQRTELDPAEVRIEQDRASIRRIFRAEGLPVAEEYTAGVRLLRSYGYRAGALETELADRHLTIDQQAACLRGNTLDAIEFARVSAAAMADAPLDELRERSALFAQQEGGQITRVINGVNRTVVFQFDATAATLANGIGVGFEEARGKTNWEVYHGAVDAAFETEGVVSMRFNGLWRPSYDFFTSYYANSQSPAFSGMTIAQRAAARNRVTTLAGITAGSRWSSQHTRGRAIDIDRLNGAVINNGATADSRVIRAREPAIMANFTESLWATDARSLLTPWRIYPGRAPAVFNANIAEPGDQYNHRNHIHYGQ